MTTNTNTAATRGGGAGAGASSRVSKPAPANPSHRTLSALDAPVEVTVLLDGEDHEAVCEVAKRRHASKSAVIRAAVAHYLHAVGA